MNKKYIEEALGRAARAAELADRVRDTQAALDAMPREGRELDDLLRDDAYNLQIVMFNGDSGVVKAPVPVGDQMRVFAMMRASLQSEHDKALAELVREQAPTTGTH